MTRRGASPAAPLAALACAAVLAGCGSGGGAGTGVAAPANCSAVPQEPVAVLTYRLQAGAESVSESSREETIAILCRRLAAAAGGAEVGVAPLGDDRIRVSLGSGAGGVTSEEVEAPGGLYLYDWEPNLIGPERARGGYSTAYGAVRLASEHTREIALRGRAQAPGKVGLAEAEALSGHFAVVFDDEVVTLPIVNFAENPDGIDGRVGAQVSGGFRTRREAKELAAAIKLGPLPVYLEPVSQTTTSG